MQRTDGQTDKQTDLLYQYSRVSVHGTTALAFLVLLERRCKSDTVFLLHRRHISFISVNFFFGKDVHVLVR